MSILTVQLYALTNKQSNRMWVMLHKIDTIEFVSKDLYHSDLRLWKSIVQETSVEV